MFKTGDIVRHKQMVWAKYTIAAVNGNGDLFVVRLTDEGNIPLKGWSKEAEILPSNEVELVREWQGAKVGGAYNE